MKLIDIDNFLDNLNAEKSYTIEELKEIAKETSPDYDIEKVNRRILHMSGLINQSHIFEIQDIVEDGGKSKSFWD